MCHAVPVCRCGLESELGSRLSLLPERRASSRRQVISLVGTAVERPTHVHVAIKSSASVNRIIRVPAGSSGIRTTAPSCPCADSSSAARRSTTTEADSVSVPRHNKNTVAEQSRHRNASRSAASSHARRGLQHAGRNRRRLADQSDSTSQVSCQYCHDSEWIQGLRTPLKEVKPVELGLDLT